MKIPPSAQRVFRGVFFNVYHWQQKMFDGSSTTYEMVERTPTTDVIATIGKQIMVLNQRQPRRKWYPSLPGGGIEPGERPLAAAARELQEETGYAASHFRLIGEYLGSAKTYFHQYLYVASRCRKTAPQQLDAGEKIKVRFVSFDQFLELARHENFASPLPLRFMMYEALMDKKAKAALQKKIFGARRSPQ